MAISKKLLLFSGLGVSSFTAATATTVFLTGNKDEQKEERFLQEEENNAQTTPVESWSYKAPQPRPKHEQIEEFYRNSIDKTKIIKEDQHELNRRVNNSRKEAMNVQREEEEAYKNRLFRIGNNNLRDWCTEKEMRYLDVLIRDKKTNDYNLVNIGNYPGWKEKLNLVKGFDTYEVGKQKYESLVKKVFDLSKSEIQEFSKKHRKCFSRWNKKPN